MNAQVEKAITLQNQNQLRVSKLKHVDQVEIKPHEKQSIAYARCRAAINQDCYELFKDNAAGAKNFKQARKKIAAEFLGGKTEWRDKKKFVMFPDGSQARY